MLPKDEQGKAAERAVPCMMCKHCIANRPPSKAKHQVEKVSHAGNEGADSVGCKFTAKSRRYRFTAKAGAANTLPADSQTQTDLAFQHTRNGLYLCTVRLGHDCMYRLVSEAETILQIWEYFP